MTAAKGAGIIKRILIDYAYNFLKRNLRQSEKVFDIPQKRMLKVGIRTRIELMRIRTVLGGAHPNLCWVNTHPS